MVIKYLKIVAQQLAQIGIILAVSTAFLSVSIETENGMIYIQCPSARWDLIALFLRISAIFALVLFIISTKLYLKAFIILKLLWYKFMLYQAETIVDETKRVRYTGLINLTRTEFNNI